MMKRKRLCAAMLSGILAFSAMTGAIPSSDDGALLQVPASITAEAATTLRRPCNAENPMWIVHIETWNTPDPQKIINLIPEDIRPYVVFNISMSIYWNGDTHSWGMVQNGYELAKSWLKACADEGIWCMIQPSSGGQCHFPDYDSSGNMVSFPNKANFVSHADADYENTIYAEFFRDYPNFIGFNYCEQFWGFEQDDFPITCPQRYQHFASLLKLCNKYGGYLDISWCGNQWSPNINPLAMLKQVPSWEESCRNYSQNLILEEKYTQASYIADVESLVYGYYVSGYCGNFGIRYDETGWTDSTWSGTGPSSKDQFNQATGLPIYLERMVKNGATVIDGPELVTVDDFKETYGYTDSEGYHVRDWAMYDQFQNVPMDFMRKIVDGSVRIPTREEVIENTKVAIIHDVNSGWNDDKYSTYPSLFEGLYRMNGDGNLKDNHNLYKSTGRYQTIPTVYALKDNLAKSIPVQVKQSQIASRWSTISAKQDEFNKLYPSSDYYGNCYAGRNENTWIAYNYNKDGSNCGAVLSLKYNTCKDLDVNFNAYGNALINEYSDHIDIYANNFDHKHADTRRTDTFKISGCTSEPTITYKDRGVNQLKSEVTTSYSNGTYTIKVNHNGPIDISVKCSGSESNRLTATPKKALTAPAAPGFYTGARQYEAEVFDYKNIEGNVANACGSGVTGIQGQGFLKFGKNANAAVKDTVTTTKAGTFQMNLRYSTTTDCKQVDLYVNGSKVKTLSLPKGSSFSDWKIVTEPITLKEGDNKIELKANAALASSLYIDCFTVEGDFGDGEPIVIEPISGKLIQNLTVNDTENAADWRIAYDFGVGCKLYGDRDLTCASAPEGLNNAEYILTACDSKLYTKTEATFTAAKDMTVYVAVDDRVDDLLDWLAAWEKTAYTITSSNAVTFNLYAKTVKAGELVTLGTNGGYGDSANYLVFATEEIIRIKGDVNADGTFSVADVVMLQKWLICSANATLTDWKAGDLSEDNRIDGLDLCIMKNMLLEKSTAMTPAEYMAQVSATILESEPNDAVAEKAGTQYGTYEKVSFTSAVCGGRTKSMNVLLPAGYSESKEYPVLYALHGYWGNADALLDAGDASLRLRQIIGNAIAAGEAEEMIVVFPDIYASATQDACDGLDAKNNAAYDNFINVLVKEIMPYMEQHYSIKTGRDNTAITGFSMGGRESLYIGFSRPDLFGYVGAMCPAPGLDTDLIAAENLKFTGTEPYLLMVSAGSNDTLIYSTPEGYHNIMTANGTTHIWHYVTGGDHGGKTIRPHMYNFVRAIFKAN
ncbi:MAG: glycoside hydrolase family 98 domain-containing protein [Oscillospiraceae bacterium]